VLLYIKICMNLADTEHYEWYGYDEYRESSKETIARSAPKIAEQSSRLLKLVVNSRKRFYGRATLTNSEEHIIT
jgi:hypothetical protein